MLHHCHGVGGGMAAVQPNTTTCKAKTPSQKPKEVHRNKGTPEGFPLQELTDAQSQAVNFALSRRVDRLFLSPYRHSVGCRSPPLAGELTDKQVSSSAFLSEALNSFAILFLTATMCKNINLKSQYLVDDFLLKSQR